MAKAGTRWRRRAVRMGGARHSSIPDSEWTKRSAASKVESRVRAVVARSEAAGGRRKARRSEGRHSEKVRAAATRVSDERDLAWPVSTELRRKILNRPAANERQPSDVMRPWVGVAARARAGGAAGEGWEVRAHARCSPARRGGERGGGGGGGVRWWAYPIDTRDGLRDCRLHQTPPSKHGLGSPKRMAQAASMLLGGSQGAGRVACKC